MFYELRLPSLTCAVQRWVTKRQELVETMSGDASDDVNGSAAGHSETTGSAASAPAEETSEPKKAAKPTGFLAMVKEFVVVIVTALAISLAIKTFLFQMFYIPSESMEPTLVKYDRVVVSQLTPGVFDLKRGDIVVFKDPGGWLSPPVEQASNPVGEGIKTVLTFVGILPKDNGQHLIKRMVGLPGDHIKCCSEDGKLIVNGTAIDEYYIQPGSDLTVKPFDVIVPEDRIWVMGDNRNKSVDSRFNRDKVGDGSVALDSVVGRATMIAWPIPRWSWLGNFDDIFGTVSDKPDPSTLPAADATDS